MAEMVSFLAECCYIYI